jgi:very-short-patch-repair endonuclease
MTKAEVRLWMRLKKIRANGFHFRRQAPFRGYFLDFVCFSRKLVVELDGWRHAEDDQAHHDDERDAVLRREGFTVLRFWNHALDKNIDGVMVAIEAALSQDSPTRPSLRDVHPPHEGEG